MARQATQASQTRSRRTTTPKGPELAKAECLDKATRARLEDEVDQAVRRRAPGEAKLGGALRAVAVVSPAVRGALGAAAETLAKKAGYGRELYVAGIRALAESGDRRAPAMLRAALAAEEAGGSATLSAACFSDDPALAAPLGKLASLRQPFVAFAAETARVVRRESGGQLLTSLAPMIKESHRLALCAEVFLPLARVARAPAAVGPALAILRDAERHLGRWLVLGEVAARGGDPRPLDEAKARASDGPSSSRAAWSLVAWALEDSVVRGQGGPGLPAPTTRPTVEVMARLSDRPSADRDPTFLFRLARAGSKAARPMLEALVKGAPLGDDAAVRAASYLARDHGRDDLRDALWEAASTTRKDELRGLATAALWDAGDHARAREVADELLGSRTPSSVAWAALVRAAASGLVPRDVVGEASYRWIQWGALD